MLRNQEHARTPEVTSAILDRLNGFQASLEIVNLISDQMEKESSTPNLTPETTNQPPKADGSNAVVGEIQERLEDIYKSQEAA